MISSTWLDKRSRLELERTRESECKDSWTNRCRTEATSRRIDARQTQLTRWTAGLSPKRIPYGQKMNWIKGWNRKKIELRTYGVLAKPLNITLVARVEKYRSRRVRPVQVRDNVALLKFGIVSWVEIKMIDLPSLLNKNNYFILFLY